MMKEKLSNIDTALLRLEHPTNPMMVTGIIQLQEPLEYAALIQKIETRLLRIDRFRQKIFQPRLKLLNPYWEYDDRFDLNYHVQTIDLPSPGDQTALQELISQLASTQLDLTRSPWQFHLIENYEGGSVLICRLHHAIADGSALVYTILALTDTHKSVTKSSPKSDLVTQNPFNQNWGILNETRKSFIKTRRRVRSRIQRGTDVLRSPMDFIEKSQPTIEAIANIGRLILFEEDPATVLRGKLGTSKRVAWSEGIPLEDIKTIRIKLGGTVNDILMTAMTGAIRRYLLDHDEQAGDIQIHAFVPVNLRTPGTESDLGNQMGAVFVSLPVNIEDPTERLLDFEHRMNGHKGSMEAQLYHLLLGVLGKTPESITNDLIYTFGPKATAVMTNVRGPDRKLYLVGSPIESVMFWVPQTGRLGIGISFLSYAGVVRVGIITDNGLVPEPYVIIQAFHEEYKQLQKQALEVKTQRSIHKMSTMLDDAIDKVDVIIRNKPKDNNTPSQEP